MSDDAVGFVTEITKQIQDKSIEIRGLKMRHYNASTRSEKIKITKQLKAAEAELEKLRETRKQAQAES